MPCAVFFRSVRLQTHDLGTNPDDQSDGQQSRGQRDRCRGQQP